MKNQKHYVTIIARTNRTKNKLKRKIICAEIRYKEKIVEEDSKFAEATAALQVLGYTRKEIEKALNKMDKTLTVEEIIKKGLNNLARQ